MEELIMRLTLVTYDVVFQGPFPVSHSALHKASRALVDRSKTASSSKPGHMPKARPLRSQGSAGATASTSSATSTFTAPSTSTATAASLTSGPSAQDGDADVSLDETVPDTWAASKGDNLPETDEDQAASSKGASSVEASGKYCRLKFVSMDLHHCQCFFKVFLFLKTISH